MKSVYRPVVAFVVTVLAAAAIYRATQGSNGPELVPWRMDFASATKEAASSHKPLMIDFTATWCGPCQRLKGTTWADKDVAAALQAYVPARVDIDAQRDLALKYDIQAVPTLVVMNDQGHVMRRVEGYVDPTEFMKWLTKSANPEGGLGPDRAATTGELAPALK